MYSKLEWHPKWIMQFDIFSWIAFDIKNVLNIASLIFRYYCDYCDTYLTHDSVSIWIFVVCFFIYMFWNKLIIFQILLLVSNFVRIIWTLSPLSVLLLHFGYSIRSIIHKKSGCALENGNKIWNEFSQSSSQYI